MTKPGEQDSNFAFSNADFERVRRLIQEHAGIALSDAKRQLAYGRLSRRLRALGLQSFTTYLDQLESGRIDEWQEFINALTTNLTSFFRESHHFPILAAHLTRAGARHPQRIWCSAASTGEEPYTLAMTAMEAFNTNRPPVEIVATDIDTNVLAQASAGVYTMEVVSKLEQQRLRRFFLKGKGASTGMARVRSELQALIQFRPLNLLAANYGLDGPFDAIFCRNVMIYFDKPTQRSILEKFVPLLAPDGLLFCGHSENFVHARDILQLDGKTVYRLAAARSAKAA
jgi:chemotaxis protein methyltransferase CheR